MAKPAYIEKCEFNEGLNGDDAYTRLSVGEYLNGFNFRSGTSEFGKVSGLQPIPSSTLVYGVLPTTGLNICIGSCFDEEDRRTLWFNWNSLGQHGIYCYDTVNERGDPVLLNAQVTGGLNFGRFNYIHSCFVVNGNLYWTDNFNQPRRINIQYGLEMNFDLTNPLPGYVASPTTPALQNLVGSDLYEYYDLPNSPVPSYQSGELTVTFQRQGHGPLGIPTFIPILTNPALWAQYPGTKSYQQIVADAINNYFTVTNPAGGNAASVGVVDGRPGLFVNVNWDWNTGDPTFAPLTQITLLLNSYVRLDGKPTHPYIAPLTQSSIAIVRRQPAYPPTAVKATDGPNSLTAQNAYQAYYRYIYLDYEQSTLSGASELINFNATGDLFNKIVITIPLQESIDQDVRQIDLVVQNLASGVDFVIRTWDISVPADEAAIIAHNNKTTALSYSFYDDQVGTALSSAYGAKPFDSAPLLAQSIELAKNLLFEGGVTLGYTSPPITSLAATIVTSSSIPTTPVGEWHFLQVLGTVPGTGFPGTFSENLLYLTNFANYLGGNGYYRVTGLSFGPPPAIVPFTSLVFAGADEYTAGNFIASQTGVLILQNNDLGVAASITGLPTPSPAGGQVIFKSAASYQVAIEFEDDAGIKCGAVTNQGLRLTTPDRTYANVPWTSGIAWALSNLNAQLEIPVWAKTYSILITKCLRTRFFLQGRSISAAYATQDPVTQVYSFTEVAYSSTAAGCAFDISPILAFQMGYTFTQGDVMKIYLPSGFAGPTEWTLQIIAQVGNWVVTELQDIAIALNNTTTCIFEIYTPYKKLTTEPFYEVKQFFPIGNPGTINRVYSSISGTIGGDVYIAARSMQVTDPVTHIVSTVNYQTEAMSPIDKFWQIWNTNTGRSTFIDKIGQVVKTKSISFSNAFIQGSQINGLSTFDALDTQDLSQEFGDISKLKLASKIQKEGSIMLAICVSETVSLYLSEVQVAAPQGNAFLSTSSGVIGTIYPLKGSFGTIHPESVKEYRGDVFFADAYNGGIVQYSPNGLELVSKFKMRTFWRKWFRKYITMSQAEIVSLGSQPFLPGGIDPFNGEYLISIPQIEAINPAGLLPGGITGAPENLFNIYDGQAKTMAYKIEQNKWMPPYSYCAESMVDESNLLYGFKAGAAWLMNDDNSGTFNNFFGIAFPSQVMFAPHAFPNSPKDFLGINLESDLEPDSCYVFSDYPWIQITDLVGTDFSDIEGVFYAAFFKDRLSPPFTDPNKALYYGDKMIAKAPMIQLNFTASQLFHLKYVNIGYQLSAGHRTIASK